MELATKKDTIIRRLSWDRQPVQVNNNLLIYRVPNQVYQMFFDMIPKVSMYAKNTEVAFTDIMKDTTKGNILRELKSFISDKFPGLVIVDIQDYSDKEAKQIHPLMPWGMFVLLAEGHYDGTHSLENSIKLLEND